MSYPAIKQAITAGGFVEVTLPTGHGCSSFSLWTEDGAKWEYSHNAAGDDNIVVTADGATCMAVSFNMVKSNGAVLCYAKGTTTTNLVGIITKT